jgi:hypothetical protein
MGRGGGEAAAQCGGGGGTSPVCGVGDDGVPLHVESVVVELPLRVKVVTAELPLYAEAAAELPRPEEAAFPRRCPPGHRHAVEHREAYDYRPESQRCRCESSYRRRWYPRRPANAHQEARDCWLQGQLLRLGRRATAR